jgi:hypothetical protein
MTAEILVVFMNHDHYLKLQVKNQKLKIETFKLHAAVYTVASAKSSNLNLNILVLIEPT